MSSRRRRRRLLTVISHRAAAPLSLCSSRPVETHTMAGRTNLVCHRRNETRTLQSPELQSSFTTGALREIPADTLALAALAALSGGKETIAGTNGASLKPVFYYVVLNWR